MDVSVEKLPPLGEMVRKSSITRSSSGVNGAPFALSKSPLIVFVEGRAHFRIAAVFGEARHHAEHRIAPLAERHEIVEAFEHDIFFGEIFSVAGVLEPVVGDGLVGTAMRPFSMSLSRASIHFFRKGRSALTVI